MRASTLDLCNKFFGIYDWYMRHALLETYTKGHFRATDSNKEIQEKIKRAKNITEFYTMGAPLFGYNGASRLFRKVSCDAFVSQIETPLLALVTKDDSITDYKFVPKDDLKRNPNIILATLERGGHCDLFY